MEKVSLTYGPVIPQTALQKTREGASAKPFGDVLKQAVQTVDKMQHEASKSVDHANAGTGGLPEAMIAMEKASIALQTMLTVRNKVIEAYQDVMRMQV